MSSQQTSDKETLRLIDLASERLGGAVLAASDDFFAPKERLNLPEEPIFIPDKYVPTGKWMDGWESRRRRTPGHDWCVLRLGARGAIARVVVDTSFFVGNFPEECSIEGCDRSGLPGIDELLGAETSWSEILPRTRLAGNCKNSFDTASGDRPFTHIRLHIFPDGGVARLRAWGRAVPNWDLLDFSGELVDLAAAENGARIAEVSDMFFGAAQNMLLPGRARDMSEGWESRRRRGPGHDWVIVELGARGRVLRCEVDTLHFKGNAPGRCAIDVRDGDREWAEILPETRLGPHQLHRFQEELSPGGWATHLRLRIYPDGGVSRLRVLGRTARGERLAVGLGKLHFGGDAEARAALLRCCACERWADGVLGGRPYASVAQLLAAADRLWRELDPAEWKRAFAAHPRIGERAGSDWSRQEQAGVGGPPDRALLEELAEKNRLYEERFGFVFLICATGKSGAEMLAALRRRLAGDPEAELQNAAEEQRQITRLRLEKWLTE